MAIKFVQTVDMGQNQILNLQIQNLATDPSSPVLGQIWFNTTSNVLKIYDGTANRVIAEINNSLSAFAAPTSSLNAGSFTIQNVATPVNATDAANKGYVDAATIGLDVKASCRVAATGNINIAAGLVTGTTIDGVTVATGDRVLLKNQTTASQNGIYVVVASGAASLSTDCNSSTNYVTGAFTFIESGTVNAGSGFVVSTQGTIVPGTTPVTWTQFSSVAYTLPVATSSILGGVKPDGTSILNSSGAISVTPTSVGLGNVTNAAQTLASVVPNTIPSSGQVLVGNGGGTAYTPVTVSGDGTLSNTGSLIVTKSNGVTIFTTASTYTGTLTSSQVVAALTYTPVAPGANSTITSITGLTTALAVNQGGTGSATAAGARTNLGATGKYAANFGDGSSLSYVITHNLGTNDVVVGVYSVAAPYQVEMCEVQLTSANTITLLFASAPSTNQFRVVVIG